MGERIVDYTIYMKSSSKKMAVIASFLGVLLLAEVMVMLYMKDSKTAQKALVVRAYLVNYCMENAQYPAKEEFEQRFPKLAENSDWLYWPAEDLTQGTFQYPMTLPVPSAPGDSKFSEFIPIIYSYSVRNPCQIFSRALL